MDILEAHKEGIEQALYFRLADLLNLDVELIFYETQNWRVIAAFSYRVFDFAPLAQPFLLNSMPLALHERLRKSLFELK